MQQGGLNGTRKQYFTDIIGLPSTTVTVLLIVFRVRQLTAAVDLRFQPVAKR